MDAKVKTVIFDVDGTLYDQGQLRWLIAVDALYCLVRMRLRPLDLSILYHFRKNRARLSADPSPHLEWSQYHMTASRLNLPIQMVEVVVRQWILERPLRYLQRCRAAGVSQFFQELTNRGIRIGIFSDYPARAKLRALNLSADSVVCATDPDVDAFKPDPKGLFVTADQLGTPVDQCLYIGDREEKDGEAARRAGMDYLILAPKGRKDFFVNLGKRMFDGRSGQN